MTTRTILLALLIPVLAATAAGAAETVSVLLQGHDEPITGWLRQVSESRYILQSSQEGQELFHSFPADQIVAVDGRPEVPESARGSGRLLEYASYEVVRADGDVEVWSRFTTTNKAGVLTRVKFGAKESELPLYRDMQAFDQYGNELAHRIEPRNNGLYSVVIELAVPAGFQEEFTLSLRTIRRDAVRREGDTWTYVFNPEFPEDRIYTRKVVLPAGARFVSATPTCRPWTDVHPPTLYWYRYYPARTREEMHVVYRLAD